ncbi:MAG TPA: hypothetical protein VHQ65_13125 [Thermoanaerobaculia bacterium]|nr:hypothetical protein [Thermoanaerobaculia bacterium]
MRPFLTSSGRRLPAGLLAATLLLLAGANPASAYWFKKCSHGTHWAGATTRVTDVHPGPADAVYDLFGLAHRSELLAAYAGALYFQADDGSSGAELWRASAGTAGLVAEIVAGPGGSAPHAFAGFQGQLHFAATTPTTGEELFRFDGTAVSLAADTLPGTDGGRIFGLGVHDGALYFARAYPNHGREVWRYDGTVAVPVAAINQAPGRIDGNGDRTFVSFGGKLYFVRDTPLPEKYELWSYDGLSASRVLPLTLGNDLVEREFHLAVHLGALYFGRVVPHPSQPYVRLDQLWRWTGQGAPVHLGTLGSAASYTQPRYFQSFQGKLYFSANGVLHRLDGAVPVPLTAGGAQVPPGPRSLSPFAAANRLYLAGSDPTWSDTEPHLFDGTVASLLKNIQSDNAQPYGGSFPGHAVETDGLYFFAEDDLHGRELWRTARGPEIPYFRCDIVVALPLDRWHDWPLETRRVLVESWFVGLEETRRLAAEWVEIDPTRETRLAVLEIDTRRGALPEGFALVTLVTDGESGARLEEGFELVGDPGAEAAAKLERMAQEILATGRF